ncbi:hypothetical protein NE398_21360, partial [Clostridium tertium]
SKEVQKVFLDWWKPQSADLFKYKLLFNVVDCLCGEAISPFNENYVVFKKDCIPLFTEGQLRKFIEDKTNGKVESYYAWDYYTIAIRNTGCGGDDPQCDTEETNLLQAYWKLACMVAKEAVDE